MGRGDFPPLPDAFVLGAWSPSAKTVMTTSGSRVKYCGAYYVEVYLSPRMIRGKRGKRFNERVTNSRKEMRD